MRQTERSKHGKTPIVLASGNVDQELLSRIGRYIAGALIKPFTPSAAVTRLFAILPALKELLTPSK
jgi:hypothetical protein